MINFAPVLTLFITGLVPASQAATTKQERSSAVSKLLRGKGPKVDTSELVGSLGEVAKGLQAEGNRAWKLAQSSSAECKKTETALKLSLDKDKRAVDVATEEYKKNDAQVQALQASKTELESQITDSNTQLNDLQAKLKKMRKDQGLLKKSAASSLRQINTVIDQLILRGAATAHHKGPSSLDLKVSTLERLSKSLSLLQTRQKVEMRQHQHKAAPSVILTSDKQTVIEANDEAEKGFDEEEKKTLELIDVERKKLKDLEDNLQELQPAITNKLKQVLEINMTLTAANRGIERSEELLHITHDKCDLVAHFLDVQKKSRDSVVNDVTMASKLIEHMDTTLFLARDIQSFKPTTLSLLQLFTGIDHDNDSQDAASLIPYSFIQDTTDATSMGLQSLIESYSASIEMTEGPFDKVTKMISGLIASLKAQANEAVTQNQFCQDSMGENRNDRVSKSNDIDSLDSTVRWSQMAIVRLADDIEYLEGEKKHLADAIDAEAKALEQEQHRVNRELHEHQLGHEVVTKAVEVLTQLCDLGSSASSLIQEDSTLHLSEISSMQGESANVVSRFDQCKEAADLLRSGAKELDHLDEITKDYVRAYSDMSQHIVQHANDAEEAVHTQLRSTKASKAQRASELANANKDLKKAHQELKLIETAKKELEHQCSHVETREEKMAKRQDEIDALKEALNVLEGESMAVP